MILGLKLFFSYITGEFDETNYSGGVLEIRNPCYADRL